MSGETVVINGDLAGRDIVGGGTGRPGDVSVSDIVAAKLKAKQQEIEREAQEDAEGVRQGGVTINGGVVTIGGRVVSGDLIVNK